MGHSSPGEPDIGPGDANQPAGHAPLGPGICLCAIPGLFRRRRQLCQSGLGHASPHPCRDTA